MCRKRHYNDWPLNKQDECSSSCLLKTIRIDPLSHSFQDCHAQLLRHKNIYLQHVKQIIKTGGPWENPVLQGILKEADLPSKRGISMTTFIIIL